MSSSSHPHLFRSIFDIVEPFKGVLLDAYGVFWGGSGIGILPGAKEAMEVLVAENKVVGILSNSFQLVQHEIEKLQNFDLYQGVHYHFYITSAEVQKKFMKTDQDLTSWEVSRFSKPSPTIFLTAFQEFATRGVVDRASILMVGDTPEIDIRGASSVNIASALVLNTGVMSGRSFRTDINSILDQLPATDVPNFLIASLGAVKF